MTHLILSSLPGEILEAVFRRLDCLALLRCCSVCRLIKEVIDNSSEFQYTIELARDGMVDHPTRLSHADRLAKLRRLREAWNGLDWKTHSVIPMQGLCHAYELVEGMFVKGAGGADFSISWLPSTTEKGRQMYRSDLQIPARDFAIDPGQDLVIFVDDVSGSLTDLGRIVKLHIRTISTHEVHESARQPVLQFTVPSDHFIGTFIRTIILELAGDMLAVFLTSGTQRLLIWNWKEGYLITDSILHDHKLPRHVWDFAFITPRAYILTSREAYGYIQIMSLEDKSLTKPTHIASLHLPALEGDITVLSLTTHTGPLNTPSSGHPFIASLESRIHVLLIRYGGSTYPHTHYRVFLRNRTFLSYLDAYTSGKTPAGIRIPWSAWGMRNTRFFAANVEFSWLRYVQGQRVVLPPAINDPLNSRTLQILDFNVRPDIPPSDSGAVKTICTKPTWVPRNDIFGRNVITRLPYSTITRKISDNYSAFMIDEDRILGLKAQGVAQEELQELHVFTF